MKTIVAVSTAPMTSAIGIVRISGDRAFEITEKVFSKPLSNVDGYRVVYGKIYDGKKVLDTVLATVFRSPNSYTPPFLRYGFFPPFPFGGYGLLSGSAGGSCPSGHLYAITTLLLGSSPTE